LISLKIGAIAIAGIGGLLLIGTLLNFASYRSKLIPPIRVIPSAESIGHDYLQAVIQKNHNYIGGDNGCVHAQFVKDIVQYGGAEVKNIVVKEQWDSGNSDAQFEVTSIRFDYRSTAKPSWQSGEIRLLTATNQEVGESLWNALPFRRIHCAGPGV
jgi:hypothetical protein